MLSVKKNNNKTLFVIHSGNFGGPVTSLINMLDLLKNHEFEFDVFLMAHVGDLTRYFLKEFNVLKEDKILASAICKKSDYKRRFGVIGLVVRFFVFLSRRINNNNFIERIYAKAARRIGRYDVVVSYQENLTTDFSKYICANKRIAWVHTMFEQFSKAYASLDQVKKTYSYFDNIVCVADGASEAFEKAIPEFKSIISVINNPISIDRVRKLSIMPEVSIQKHNNLSQKLTFVSVGRLSREKQYDMAIEVAVGLKKQGIAFNWYIVGDGEEKSYLTSLVAKYSLENEVVLLGYLSNPYPIIKDADLLVITSLYEAQPMVALEALLLHVPVVTTNYPTAYSLIKNGKNGLICRNEYDDILKTLLCFSNNIELRKHLKKGAEEYTYDNEKICKSVLRIINNG